MSLQTNRRPITFFVPATMHDALMAHARDEGEAASTVLRRLLTENLPGLRHETSPRREVVSERSGRG